MKNNLILIGSRGYLGSLLSKELSKTYNIIYQETGDWSPKKNYGSETSVLYLRNISSPNYVTKHPISSININYFKSKKLISKLLEEYKVIFFSSDTVYGETNGTIATEESHCKPLGLYGVLKHAIEKHFFNHPNFYSLRLSQIYGEGTKLNQIMNNEKLPKISIPIFRNFINVKEYIYISSQLLQKINSGNVENFKIFNLGGIKNRSICDLANEIVQNKKDILYVQRTIADRISRPSKVMMDSSLIRRIIGE